MANSKEREHFWNVLNSIFDSSEESAKRLASSMPKPNRLCRFRTVNESTLSQLQSNKLFFSSADYYDDPFDTYFYLNHEIIRIALNYMANAFTEGGIQAIQDILLDSETDLTKVSLVTTVLQHIDEKPPGALWVEEQLHSIRRLIQKNSYSICFCEDPFNESLWLKYADSYKGFVQIYDTSDPEIFPCDEPGVSESCPPSTAKPTIYPVYYSDTKYDATKYAITEYILNYLPQEVANSLPRIAESLAGSVAWEIERISLIKKQCHEHDAEWRMLYPICAQGRPAIGMKPSRIALGLRMPEYERRLVISAAHIASISEVFEMYIDETDNLNMRPIKNA